jgi:RNA polymerase sigma factor (TIGR02999 family)
MPEASTPELTQLLRAWGSGDERALEKLMPLVYDELHRAARVYMAHQPADNPLQTTALVNEVYLRLVNFHEGTWQNRAHFFAVCAKLMRRILVDIARELESQKRGGGAARVLLEDALAVSREAPAYLLALHDALEVLATVDERKAKVVELRFYGGLSVKETGEVLKVSEETVHRDWRLAKLWLLRELSEEKGDES